VTYASQVIGDDVVLATDSPINVVCVAEGAVYIVAADVPTLLLKEFLNVFAICFPYPNAIAKATAVPAGSASTATAAQVGAALPLDVNT